MTIDCHQALGLAWTHPCSAPVGRCVEGLGFVVDTHVCHRPGIDLLVEVIGVDSLLSALDPPLGDWATVFELDARRVFPRLQA